MRRSRASTIMPSARSLVAFLPDIIHVPERKWYTGSTVDVCAMLPHRRQPSCTSNSRVITRRLGYANPKSVNILKTRIPRSWDMRYRTEPWIKSCGIAGISEYSLPRRGQNDSRRSTIIQERTNTSSAGIFRLQANRSSRDVSTWIKPRSCKSGCYNIFYPVRTTPKESSLEKRSGRKIKER